MTHAKRFVVLSSLLVAGFLPFLFPQITPADYERAMTLRDKYSPLALDVIDRSGWIEGTSRFWYRKSVPGGTAFFTVDANTLEKSPAFDAEKLAKSLSEILGRPVDAKSLPFQEITFTKEGASLEFDAGDWRIACDLATYACVKGKPLSRPGRGSMSMWERGPAPQAASAEVKASPDGAREAFIRDYNLFVRSKDKKEEQRLSWDGSEGDYYTFESIVWSPDSRRLAAYKLRRGYHRVIQYVESSPAGQLQPKYHTMEYAKPGDLLDVSCPVLFQLEPARSITVDNSLFPNPFELSEIVWRKDSRAFTFEYNARGHQIYRIIEVDAATGAARAVVSEETKTFFYYSPARTAGRRGDGKKFRHDLDDGREIIWMSERDGWNHLYLCDGVRGVVKNQITKGPWVVRGVEKVDEAKRQIWFLAGGIHPGQDPYFVHACRINFDGSELKVLTGGDGNHSVQLSPDLAFYLDTWSRVDLPPVTELRRTADNALLMTVEKADIQALREAGWKPPEVFTAKGRDGKTDVWGILYRSGRYDPAKKYPVIEMIYAGPQGSYVPKSFQAYNAMQSLAELGFFVSQMDGMGTSNRSKAFHDVCWKNLKDAGFPDRILWHQAMAAKDPSYDITRMGIYGNSAGGQNALGGMLFYPDFYRAAVSSCGCHDNRMDKIWWNEQWMGWPLGPEYAASSNRDNASRLKGKLLLIVGEMDTNVDPASTMQVADALIKAEKEFDLLVIPGGGHGMGGAYGTRKMMDFFVRHLHGVEPPAWNSLGIPLPAPPAGR